MGQVSGRRRTFQASAAIARYLRVKLSSGKLAAAGLADNDIGTLDYAALAADEYVPVNLRSLEGTELVVAAGEITLGAAVYTAASGRVSATAAATSYKRGIALEAATAAGDIIEILPLFTNTAESG